MIKKRIIMILLILGVITSYLELYVNSAFLSFFSSKTAKIASLVNMNTLIGYIFFKIFFDMTAPLIIFIVALCIRFLIKDIKLKHFTVFLLAFYLTKLVIYLFSYYLKYRPLIEIKIVGANFVNIMIGILFMLLGWRIASIFKNKNFKEEVKS